MKLFFRSLAIATIATTAMFAAWYFRTMLGDPAVWFGIGVIALAGAFFTTLFFSLLGFTRLRDYTASMGWDAETAAQYRRDLEWAALQADLMRHKSI